MADDLRARGQRESDHRRESQREREATHPPHKKALPSILLLSLHLTEVSYTGKRENVAPLADICQGDTDDCNLPAGMLYLLFFGSGASALIYEVVWVRVFANVFGNTVYSASIVTAVFMLRPGHRQLRRR